MSPMQALTHLHSVAELGNELREDAAKCLEEGDVDETESFLYAAQLATDLAEWLTTFVADNKKW